MVAHIYQSLSILLSFSALSIKAVVWTHINFGVMNGGGGRSRLKWDLEIHKLSLDLLFKRNQRA